jgi:hypothetical protein
VESPYHSAVLSVAADRMWTEDPVGFMVVTANQSVDVTLRGTQFEAFVSHWLSFKGMG